MAKLKSREILAERQSLASSNISKYKEPSTWKEAVLRNKRNLNQKSALDMVQNPLGILGGVVANGLQMVTTGEVLNNTNLEGLTLASGSLKYTRMGRYQLLLKGSNGMEQSEYSTRPAGLGPSPLVDLPQVAKSADAFNSHTTKTLSQAEKNSPESNKISTRRLVAKGASVSFTPTGRNYIEEKLKALEQARNDSSKNQIAIINVSSSPYQSLILQNRPNELNVEPKSTWVSINSIGRNNPFMMYTGGEDTISFDLSWFANDPAHRDEVVWKCKLLESWSKADGYLASPPILWIKWGNSEIFTDKDTFILESARYTLSHFQDRATKTAANGTVTKLDLKLNPNCATQHLVFKRVTMNNRSHEDIVPLDKLQGIRGITHVETFNEV